MFRNKTQIWYACFSPFFVCNFCFFKFVLKGCIKNVDFSHSRAIARAVNKSKYVIMRTRERIGRTFSTRRSGVNSLKSSVSMEQIDTPSKLTSSPSMRLSRVFTKNLNFLTPSSLSRQQASSVVNINVSIFELVCQFLIIFFVFHAEHSPLRFIQCTYYASYSQKEIP